MLERFYIEVTFRRSNGHLCPAGAYGNNWSWDEAEEKLFVENGVFEGVTKVLVKNGSNTVLLSWNKDEVLNA